MIIYMIKDEIIETVIISLTKCYGKMPKNFVIYNCFFSEQSEMYLILI